MICCTFAGHRDVLHKGAREAVEAAVHELLKKDDEFCFYTGGMGEFDALCEGIVRKLRKEQPEKNIRLILVEPYMKQSINNEGRWLYSRYDEVILPDSLAGIHYKAAIQYRNRWMAEHSQCMIAYVRRDHGGAHAAMTYALRLGLDVIRI